MTKQIITVNQIDVAKRTIGSEEVNSVDARELYEFLNSKQEFSHWIKAKVVNNIFFKENQDFISFENIIKRTIGATTRKDYILSLDTAKIIAFNDKGTKAHEAYRYFCAIDNTEVVVKQNYREEYYFGKEIIYNLFSSYKIIEQYPVFNGRYRIDWYIPELNLAIEFDEERHISHKIQDAIRQREIEQELNCRFIRYKK